MKESISRVEATFFGRRHETVTKPGQAKSSRTPEALRLTTATTTVAAVFRVVHLVSTQRVSAP